MYVEFTYKIEIHYSSLVGESFAGQKDCQHGCLPVLALQPPLLSLFRFHSRAQTNGGADENLCRIDTVTHCQRSCASYTLALE